MVLYVAITPIIGCTSASVGAEELDTSVDTETSRVVPDVATFTDDDLDTLLGLASDSPDVALDALDSDGGLEGFQIGQGCEDVVRTDVCVSSCEGRECGYGNCGVDCGSCSEGTICVGTTCSAVEAGTGCSAETDPEALLGGSLLNTAV